MKIVRATGIAGLVLAAGALPVTAFALTSGEDPQGPPIGVPGAVHATATHPAEPAESEDTDETAEPEGTEAAEPNANAADGRGHAAEMKVWAACVAEAASGPKAADQTMPPKTECPEKPMAPGRAKHLAADGVLPGHSGDHATTPHGKSGSHRR